MVDEEDGYEKAAYSADLNLDYSVTYLDGRQRPLRTQTLFLNPSVYCTETLKALEDLGIVNENRRLLTYAQRIALDNLEKGTPTYYDDPYSGVYYKDSFGTVYPEEAYVPTQDAYVPFDEAY